MRRLTVSLALLLCLLLAACGSAPDADGADTDENGIFATAVKTKWSPDLLFESEELGLIEISESAKVTNRNGDNLTRDDLREGDLVELRFDDSEIVIVETYPAQLQTSVTIINQ